MPMPFVYITLALFISFKSLAASGLESELSKKCKANDLDSCVDLTAQFMKNSRWADAYLLGDALCKKDVFQGCTYAGTSAIVKGSAKIGFDLLSKACDGFEPYACRSLADIAKKSKEDKMRYMYQKRACYSGLDESCKNLNKPDNLYSTKGLDFFKKLLVDCENTNATSCRTQLENLSKCPEPLTKEDCFLMPGDLSIVFRAKLIQDGGKLTLLKVLAAQKMSKENKKRYSYDLSSLMQDEKEFASSKYVFGFQVACTKKYENQKAQSTSLGVHPQVYKIFSEQTKRTIIALYKKGKADDCYDPSLGFEAFAVGKLDPLNPTKLDIWKINTGGDIVQIQNGRP
jgi:hypothetical protein